MRLPLGVDPAEADRRVERLGVADRALHRALLGDLQPDADRLGVVVLEPGLPIGERRALDDLAIVGLSWRLGGDPGILAPAIVGRRPPGGPFSHAETSVPLRPDAGPLDDRRGRSPREDPHRRRGRDHQRRRGRRAQRRLAHAHAGVRDQPPDAKASTTCSSSPAPPRCWSRSRTTCGSTTRCSASGSSRSCRARRRRRIRHRRSWPPRPRLRLSSPEPSARLRVPSSRSAVRSAARECRRNRHEQCRRATRVQRFRPFSVERRGCRLAPAIDSITSFQRS